MSRKISAVLFGLFLFLLGIVVCVKPTCARVVHEAFLGRAVALRANDAIWEWYPDVDENLDWAIQLQEKVTDHRQLDRIAAKYLDALADYYQVEERNLEGIFEDPDVSENLEALNQDIIKELETKFGPVLNTAEKERFWEELYEAEYPVVEILNELPYFIRNFGDLAWTALGLYAVLTSLSLPLVLVLILAALGFWMYRGEKQKIKWLLHMAILFLADGVVIGVFLPFFVRSVSYGLTNRLIGRAWAIDMFAFWYMGILFLLAGAVLLLIWFRRIKKCEQQAV